MTDDERKRIRAVSEALLARRFEQKPPEPAPTPEPEPEVYVPDELERWKSWHDERAREREAELRRRRAYEERHHERQRAADAAAAVDAKIEAAIGGYHEQVIKIVGAALHEAKAPILTSFAEIESKLAKLATTLADLRAHEDRRPLDLPNPLSRARIN